ncbi:hypothetical protein H8356DRAFT_1407492 [Neocallimastix lanati (nom. inval.)]|uniref:Uncharacterized protein n=1 Tax=Neocallimastix californiae TaxID=1754190 RepID=A0A1Y2AZH5_9FUNG|nr:hypothetical protein H8356DRAFT_1407492 [Neocallimastix sp. JGI-2020a]ORY27700.1 hypothetical protein LY90DRAFT_513349 [Neocallimastix californiae]|eukprot:ORY27700.1 hypothetical protein LY90DRAFT_513349 [Neocallimastix californiae]
MFIDSLIISYIWIIWIISDPVVNILAYSFFHDNRNKSYQIIYFSNTITSCFIFIEYYAYIIYIILKKKGNKKYEYFINIPHIKCVVHNSYRCHCTNKKIKIYSEDELQSIEEYTYFYTIYFNWKIIMLLNIPYMLKYYILNKNILKSKKEINLFYV